jgi:hypothetical protein
MATTRKLRTSTRADSADGAYNRGNALAQLGRYEEAIAAYDDALKHAPDMPDAVANRKIVEDALKRQQQQQQNQQGQNDQQKNGDDKKQGDPQQKSGEGDSQKKDQDSQQQNGDESKQGDSKDGKDSQQQGKDSQSQDGKSQDAQKNDASASDNQKQPSQDGDSKSQQQGDDQQSASPSPQDAQQAQADAKQREALSQSVDQALAKDGKQATRTANASRKSPCLRKTLRRARSARRSTSGCNACPTIRAACCAASSCSNTSAASRAEETVDERFAIRFALCAFAWLAIAAHAADAPRAWLDRTTMHIGETVTLNVETTDAGASAPDFSVLSKDFDVGGTQSSQQVSIVNGARDAKMLWAVALQPKHEGRIAIAPLAVGNAQTAPLELDVQAAAPPAQAGGDLFFEIDAQPKNPYVQQEVHYTVKLYYAIDLTGGSIGEPKADGLSAKHLGQDKQYVATVGARRYQVVEQHYALTPERSGKIAIPSLMFRGTTLDVRDPTSFFSRGREVVARSDAVALDVREQPANWPSGRPWLPVASLLLQDQSDLPEEVHVGDAVTRTVRLQAQGAGFEQLPELQLQAPDGADVYPDKSDTRTRDDGDWLYGERVRKFAIVPNKPGTLSVPGINIDWWNTQTDRLETAQLPPRTIRVLPGVGASAPPSAAPGNAPVAPQASAPPPAADANPYAPLLVDSQARFWRLAAWAVFVLWLATMLAWWLHSRRAPKVRASVDDASTAKASTHRAAFLRACSLGEFAAAERALVAWSRSERGEVRNLGELARRLGDERQRDALARLQAARYAGASSEGLGTLLHNAFKGGLAWTRVPATRASDEPLPALYPERD